MCAAERTGRTPLSASARVALGTALTLLVGVVLLAGLTYLGMISRLSSELDDRLIAEVDGYAAAIDDATLAEDLGTATRVYLSARSGGGGSTAVLLITLDDGRVLSNSETALEEADGAAEIISGTTTPGFETVTLDGAEWRIAYAAIIGPDGSVVGTFVAGLPLADINSIAADVATTLLISGLIVVLLGSLASGLVARASLKPLRTVAAETATIGEGTLDTRIDSDGRTDEIGVMVVALNSLLGRLEGAMDDQRRFISDASHELRTPLAIIRGHLELSADERLSEAEREESLQIARDELDRMQRLIEDLLILSRLEAHVTRKRQPLDVALIVNEAVNKARTLGTQQVTYACRGHHWVSGDPDQLLQVFLNVLANAMRHSPENADVAVSCCSEGDGIGSHVVIDIDDSGPGIPAEEIARVFDRFYRSAEQRAEDGQGSGLGLAIASRIVQAHGGTIVAANLSGGGARFEIELPAIDAPED